MPLTPTAQALLDKPPGDLTAYERGVLRAAIVGADHDGRSRVVAALARDQIAKQRAGAGDDAPPPADTCAYDRGAGRAHQTQGD